MKNIVKPSIFFVLLLLSSCNDEYLELVPETEIAVDNFFNTEEDLATYVNGLYSFPDFGIYYDDEATDNAATTGNREIKTIMTTNANSTTISSGWNWSYLRDINLFLANSPKANVPEMTRKHYEGVARFFRAQFYMDKVKRFSDVPWYDTVLTTDSDDLYKSSDTRAMVIDKIFEDYQFAIDNVFTDQPSGAVNKWVVLAYASRNALFEGTFRKYHDELTLEASANRFLEFASTYSKQIMDGGAFAVHNTGKPSADYHSLFVSEDLRSNSEVIFSNISITNLRNSGFSVTVFGNYEMSPTRDLAETYLMADGSYYSTQPNYRTATFVEQFQRRDPRLSQTFAPPGWELINVSNYSSGSRNYVQQLNKSFTGYHQIKGFVNNTDQDFVNGLDVPVFRYAEVLLTYAEAQAELSIINQSILDQTVNLLRNRVGMPALQTGISADPVQAAKYRTVSSPVLLEIRRERRVELALEGRRLDDLMRWKAGKLMEQEPVGLYFPALGKYDLTGDGVEDIVLLSESENVPNLTNREVNTLGATLIYYRAGAFGSNTDVYLTRGNSGYVVATPERGAFQDPKHYYRPIPFNEVALNGNLKQVFGWN
jgi:hypothetical protein